MITKIKEIIENELNIQISEKTRKRYVSDAKKIFCKIARQRAGYHLNEIGITINSKHANVIHNIKQADDLIKTDKIFRENFIRCDSEVSKIEGIKEFGFAQKRKKKSATNLIYALIFLFNDKESWNAIQEKTKEKLENSLREII